MDTKIRGILFSSGWKYQTHNNEWCCSETLIRISCVVVQCLLILPVSIVEAFIRQVQFSSQNPHAVLNTWILQRLWMWLSLHSHSKFVQCFKRLFVKCKSQGSPYSTSNFMFRVNSFKNNEQCHFRLRCSWSSVAHKCSLHSASRFHFRRFIRRNTAGTYFRF